LTKISISDIIAKPPNAQISLKKKLFSPYRSLFSLESRNTAENVDSSNPDVFFACRQPQPAFHSSSSSSSMGTPIQTALISEELYQQMMISSPIGVRYEPTFQ